MASVLQRSSIGVVLQGDLEDLLERAQLMDNAGEVIACLHESPRFREHLLRLAREKVARLRRDLHEAEEKLQKLAGGGE